MRTPPSQPAPKHPARSPQAGFTLIELVMVVIILGILAAIIGTRYYELASQARAAAARGVAGEAMSRFSMAYQKYVLDTQTKPAALADLSNATYLGLDGSGRVNVGDYDLVYTQAGTSLTVQAFSSGGGSSLSSTSISWP